MELQTVKYLIPTLALPALALLAWLAWRARQGPDAVSEAEDVAAVAWATEGGYTA